MPPALTAQASRGLMYASAVLGIASVLGIGALVFWYLQSAGAEPAPPVVQSRPAPLAPPALESPTDPTPVPDPVLPTPDPGPATTPPPAVPPLAPAAAAAVADEVVLRARLARARLPVPAALPVLFQRRRQGASLGELKQLVNQRFPRNRRLRALTLHWLQAPR